ncbi:YafY family protein [Sinimarinibacterium sp. NLF-5-8]|uniref:helix-turn-helix transcriptional regulator n=1 Tax=Sinimarinibacterium sp. NLF-5-8 TaxID=2698684 RepID=UPI00137BEAC0|nr:transcriptional regulator [Sinimarinibacterium sp. NLF-5-8]QHS08737.1 transcriptional regulator [Sinimarinibacterium sp. NLF-5-8]
MKSFEHVYKLHRLLKSRRYPVTMQTIQDELGCSLATAKRVLAYLRDVLGAPLETSRQPRGYRYVTEAYELPGFWFSSQELQALLTLQQLLTTFQPGLLDHALAPLRSRIAEILHSQGASSSIHRLRLLRSAARSAGACFADIASAVLQRQRVQIAYAARSSGVVTEREISPQRLTHYRDNWYLDAWCHRAQGLRTFALDCIRQVTPLNTRAQDVAEGLLEQELGGSYGILSGAPTATAVLRFTATRARWVADERWHPDQQSQWLNDGRFELRVPFHHSDELILDILRYGDDVEVVAPANLRSAVSQRLTRALAQYTSPH